MGLAAIAFLLLVAVFQYLYLREHIIAEGRVHLRQILSQAEAVHTYCRAELRPALKRLAPGAPFEPEAMSGTFITRRVMELFTRENPATRTSSRRSIPATLPTAPTNSRPR